MLINVEEKKLDLDEYIISVHYTWLEFFVCKCVFEVFCGATGDCFNN